MQAPLVELRGADLDEPAVDRAPAIVLNLGNVVPFVRPNARSADQDVAAQISTIPERLVPEAHDQRDKKLLVALLLVSFAIHIALLVLLWRPAPPLPGIELATMEVEIIASDASRASASPTAGETMPTRPPDEPQPAKQGPDASPPTPQATQPFPRQEADSSPAQSQSPSPPEQPQQQALAPSEQPQQPEPMPAPPQITTPPEQIEKPPSDVKPARPPRIESEKAQQPATTPRQHPAPVRQAKPHQDAAPKARATNSAQKATAGAKPSAAAPARKTNADPNYAGKVFAHLARFKRMPPDAQKNRSQGTASVRFVIDGGGNVGSVQLVGSSGVASLDQEALAWPRRASPFPPPPGGQSIPITAPLRFRF